MRHLYLLFFCGLLWSGCNPCLKMYSKALNDYNTGAALAMQVDQEATAQPLLLDAGEETVSDNDSNDPFVYFTRAKQHTQAFAKCESKLSQDNKYGNALTVQALIEWQMREYQAARETRERALAAFATDPQEHDREEAIISLLPALINLLEVEDSLAQLENFNETQARDLIDAPPATRQAAFDRWWANYSTYVLDTAPGASSLKRAQRYITDAKSSGEMTQTDFNRVMGYALMRTLTQWSRMNTEISKMRRLLSITEESVVSTIENQRMELQRQLPLLKEEIVQILPEGREDALFKTWSRNLQ